MVRLDTALKHSQSTLCPRALLQNDSWRIAVYRDYYASPYVFTAYVTQYTPDGAKVIGRFGSGTLFGLKQILRHQQIPVDGAVWRPIDS